MVNNNIVNCIDKFGFAKLYSELYKGYFSHIAGCLFPIANFFYIKSIKGKRFSFTDIDRDLSKDNNFKIAVLIRLMNYAREYQLDGTFKKIKIENKLTINDVVVDFFLLNGPNGGLFITGEFQAMCSDDNITLRYIDLNYEWHDEIDANSAEETMSSYYKGDFEAYTKDIGHIFENAYDYWLEPTGVILPYFITIKGKYSDYSSLINENYINALSKEKKL